MNPMEEVRLRGINKGEPTVQVPVWYWKQLLQLPEILEAVKKSQKIAA